jgi:starvation-inducible outer membrane lipoprotein
MKKIVVSFLPLILIMAACSKSPNKITIQKKDSSAVSISKTDTIKQNHNQDRQVTGNTIIREVDANISSII